MPVRGVRRRYLYVKVESDEPVSEDQFTKTISDKVHLLYGVTGATEMNLRHIEWDHEKQAAIIRVSHTMLTEARASIAHIQKIDDIDVRLDVVRVSGTIKTLKSKL
jgi:RNase P/RNase MRP subunit POP5